MSHKKLLPLVAVSLVAGTLAACTSFAPVYGDRSGTGTATARFNFASPDNRLEQIVFDRLKLVFPGPAGPEDPVLDLAVSTGGPAGSKSNAYSVGRPLNIRVQATVTLTLNGDVVFDATRFSDTAYQGGKLTPVNINSIEGTRESGARAVAEAIRAAILSGYRPASGGVR